jgi:hypothetical protein
LYSHGFGTSFGTFVPFDFNLDADLAFLEFARLSQSDGDVEAGSDVG